MIKFLLRAYRYGMIRIHPFFSNAICRIIFYINNIHHSSFNAYGIPVIQIQYKGVCILGSNFSMVNDERTSTLGKSNRCKLLVYTNASLVIGKKVGISNTVIVVTKSVTLGDNILLGGGVTIVDSDFHSLNPSHWHTDEDYKNMMSLPVVIKDNVFIGMNSIILKGVIIGSNVVVAAGSVVTTDIPDNQIWGGNPAKFIRNNENKI